MNNSEIINNFHEKGYEFLSNFYMAPVTVGGITYTNNEAAFQAQKVLSEEEKMRFACLEPKRAKSLGRRVQLRPGWNDIRIGIMLEVVRAKFTQNPELAEKLLTTGNAVLIEGNTWRDTFWGVSLTTGRGENNLGKILMQVREELRG